MKSLCKLGLVWAMVLLHFCNAGAQYKVLRGIILDKQSDEPIPFSSAVFKLNGRGALTDSLGRLTIQLPEWPVGDTLEVSSVGYKILDIPFSFNKDSVLLTFRLEVLPPQHEAVVKAKYNRALWFWRRIMLHKPQHDRHNWNNYSYEIYNKLELDIDNINKEKIAKVGLLKPLNFALDFVDTTSEKEPFLPVYLIETLSDYYYQKNPVRTREVIKATITNGIDNESVMKQLGGTYQNVNVYHNFIPVFDKQFISPFNENGDNFYKFKLLDTQYLNKKRLVHFSFTAKHKGQSTFEGDAWVHDTTFAIQKITLRPSLDANINFITGLTIIQEYKLLHDTDWFLYKDKFVADISPLGKSKISFKGRKTATYRNIVVNDTSVTSQLAKSKSPEDIVVLPEATNLPDSVWQKSRHEPLNKDELGVYKLLDTLEKNRTYIFYRGLLNFAFTGVKDIGNFRIGPWYNWISANYWEGIRTRFDFSTNKDFSKHWYFHTYLAYGTKDGAFKGKGEVQYEFARAPWSYINFSYKHDLDNGQLYTGQLGSDNLLAYLFRKSGVPYKFQRVDEKKLDYYAENHTGFGLGVTMASRQYTPLLNLPGKEYYPVEGSGKPLNSFETSVRLRYAYKERTFAENFDRTSLGSDFPIVEVKYTRGIKGVLNSSYTYNKADVVISDFINISPYGTLNYNVFAGKVFGNAALPYQVLDVQPGNEFNYYSQYSFNLLNRYEYITDQYAGFNIEHNIGSGLFRFIPLTRKLKLRQLWEAKGVVGNLSDANKQLNFVGNSPFNSLDGKLYLEVGTGIDNIFKLFRIDFVWRVLPKPLPLAAQQRFGIFFGFRVSL